LAVVLLLAAAGIGSTQESIAVVNAHTLNGDAILCERVAVGEAEDYKPCLELLPSREP
jgi:hypothetical protein